MFQKLVFRKYSNVSVLLIVLTMSQKGPIFYQKLPSFKVKIDAIYTILYTAPKRNDKHEKKPTIVKS